MPTPAPSATAVYCHAHRAVMVAVTDRAGVSLGLEDIAGPVSWDALIAAGYGLAVAAGALSGAVAGLRCRGVSVADVLGASIEDPHHTIDRADLRRAAAWLADGLARDEEQPLDDMTAEVIGTDVLWDPHAHADDDRIAAVVFAIVTVSAQAAGERS
ncbi:MULTISPECIES: hypothetical protein [unclassified Microbacterium]|uniref:hypothetical protein n=1 Tax=unclassified Microbacterium TaxID=2609290 RepID=UPI00109BCBD3|nr:hypothetical protein [Microbacterium sp. K35]MBN6190679.1 hypothetical protein [Aneurinibacillus sp. BA2021]